MTDEAWTTATLSDDGENPPGVPSLVCTYFVARSRLHVERSASTINTTRTAPALYQVRSININNSHQYTFLAKTIQRKVIITYQVPGIYFDRSGYTRYHIIFSRYITEERRGGGPGLPGAWAWPTQ